MTQLPAALIGDAHRNGIAWETLESLVDVGNRMAGQDGSARRPTSSRTPSRRRGSGT